MATEPGEASTAAVAATLACNGELSTSSSGVPDTDAEAGVDAQAEGFDASADGTAQPDADASAEPDAGSAVSCGQSIAAFCAQGGCVQTWAEAQNTARWCSDGWTQDVLICGSPPSVGIYQPIDSWSVYFYDTGNLSAVYVSNGGPDVGFRCVAGVQVDGLNPNLPYLCASALNSVTCPVDGGTMDVADAPWEFE